jgi:hypothetical protein
LCAHRETADDAKGNSQDNFEHLSFATLDTL